jgi:hypothetical protein
MNRLTTLYCSLAVCGTTSLAIGRTPLVDPPTPPPCAADGTCYPNRGEWGWYPARWRTWPGDQLEPTPSKSPTEAEGRVSPEVSHSETPPADLEDAAAPPSSPKRDEQSTEPPAEGDVPAAAGQSGTILPNVPLPNDETPPFGPTSDHDPPPALPRTLSAQRPISASRQAVNPIGVRARASRVSTSDPPPAPPWAQSAAL